MSLQVRMLTLVMLVAGTATVATAWLTYRLASSQLAQTAAANEQDIEQIVRTLTRYGQTNGSWDGVGATVTELSQATDQRILLTTESGATVVDTDSARAGDPRPARSQAITVNSRPVLVFADEEGPVATAVTYLEIEEFRTGVRLAACLTAADIPVNVADSPHGVPHFAAATLDGDAARASEAARRNCASRAQSTPEERNADLARVNTCTTGAASAQLPVCLKAAFTDRIQDVSPEPLRLYLGARGDGSGLPAGPMIAAAGLIILLAAAGTALLSRRLLRPISALTSASRELGEGDLSKRVPVNGNDQIAELTRSFNRMANSLQEGEERQRRLVADVAHEIRTPLANLRGYLEGLTDGVIPPDPSLFASLHDEAVLQQRIVDDLQDLALAEAGALAYQWSWVDLDELLETCLIAHRARAEAAGIRLFLDTDGPVYVDADPDRLRQVVSNLVSNGLRYTAAGGTVGLRLRSDQGAAVVAVADTGCGIAEESLPYVFDRLWRADTARRRATGGSGLGLAIARQIVSDHGGTITVASRLGEGTTFTITLPVTRPASKQVPASAPLQASSPHLSASPHRSASSQQPAQIALSVRAGGGTDVP